MSLIIQSKRQSEGSTGVWNYTDPIDIFKHGIFKMHQQPILLPVVLSEEVRQQLNGKTFQIHVTPDGALRLYLVEIPARDSNRCPMVLHGHDHSEQCALKIGHEGKHSWSNGD